MLFRSYPNEYWHADVSLFRTADGAVNYIYAVVDNFSRKVIAWSVENKLSAEYRIQTIKEAFRVAHTSNNIKLIVDGGCENNNHIVDHFTSKNNIKKLIAQKDILFSNSMIEAVNKQLKYNCLFRKHIPDLIHLRLELEKFFKEHNSIKPLDVLNGYTPDEIYFELVKINDLPYTIELTEARKNRVEFNKNNTCKLCS